MEPFCFLSVHPLISSPLTVSSIIMLFATCLSKITEFTWLWGSLLIETACRRNTVYSIWGFFLLARCGVIGFLAVMDGSSISSVQKRHWMNTDKWVYSSAVCFQTTSAHYLNNYWNFRKTWLCDVTLFALLLCFLVVWPISLHWQESPETRKDAEAQLLIILVNNG